MINDDEEVIKISKKLSTEDRHTLVSAYKILENKIDEKSSLTYHELMLYLHEQSVYNRVPGCAKWARKAEAAGWTLKDNPEDFVKLIKDPRALTYCPVCKKPIIRKEYFRAKNWKNSYLVSDKQIAKYKVGKGQCPHWD